jgi:hypothetical protein
MYLKHYSNFKINQNFKHKTKMKQEKRRERIKKRILKPCDSNATRDEGSQMLALRRKGYLLHENYYFYKRILHLQYHTKKIPNIKNYSYHIPYFLLPSHTRTRLHPDNIKIKNSQQNTTPLTTHTQISNEQHISSSNTASSSNTPLSQTTVTPSLNNNDIEIEYIPIENWIPLPPNYKLADKFLPHVPQKPLFSKSGKSYHAPGSREWLEHIYKAAKKSKKSKKKAREKNVLKQEYEEQLQWEAEMARERGTSATRFPKRWKTENALDDHTSYVHKLGTRYNNALSKKNWNNFDSEADLFEFNYVEEKLNTVRYEPPEDVWAETSDDTKELEKRPLKNASPPRNLQILDIHKRPRLSPEDQEDYTEDRQKE